MENVKSRRQVAAEETRRVIVEAAARLFGERGYHATSISQVSSEAGVAPQTIYNSIGSKRDLLRAALAWTLSGDEAPTPPRVFMQIRAKRACDAQHVIRLAADFWVEARERTGPIFRAVRDAAATDPEAAELDRALARERFESYKAAAAE